MRRLLLIILTLGLASGQSSDLKYLLAAPAIMPYPSNQTVCVYVLSRDVNATFVTYFSTRLTSSAFITQIDKGDEKLHCYTFEVPLPSDGVEEIATIAVNITRDDQKQYEEKSVIIRPMRNGMFVQTDRAIYQPGEKIIMKAVDFHENLVAKNEEFTNVTFKDNQGNILKQWQNVQPNSGILELHYNLPPNILVGPYTFTVAKNDSMADVTITVDKLVLPKFEITIDAPVETTIHQSSFSINICGKYTYDKPVRGNITGKICRTAIPYIPSIHICKPIDGETDVHGCYTTEVDTDYFKFKYSGYSSYVDVEASLNEDGTGVERKATKNIHISEILAKVEFKESRGVFKSGLEYQGLMTLTGPDGVPMVDEDIELYVDRKRRDELYTTDKNGIARFTLESIILRDKVISLEARYIPRQPMTDPVDSDEVEPVYENGYASLIPFYTTVESQVKIRNEPFVLPCNENVNMWADYVLDPSEYTKETIDFHYLIITFGRIVSSSSIRQTIPSNGGLRGFFPFPVTVTSDMSPAASIVIYAGLENGDLIADSIKIPVTSCFPNTVSLQYSEEQSLPGSMVNLHISAYPNSMCSVELLKAEEERHEDTVNKFLKEWDIDGYPTQIEELQECPTGSLPVFVEASERPDIYSLFEHSAIIVLTNFVIRKPLDCELQTTTTLPLSTNNEVFQMFASFGEKNENFAAGSFVLMNAVQQVPPEEKVRKVVPSTWLMNTVSIGPTGGLDYPLKRPDTITQWYADAFCTSTVGLGFSPRTHLRVFMPFFLYMNIPYSVKQGETLVLKATVLNYMRQCIKVMVTLYQSDDFQLQPCEGCTYTACLCSDPTYTFTWNITPLTVGAINITIGTEALNTTDLCDGQKPIVPTKGQSDIVRRRLIVEPNGVPVEKTHNLLLRAFGSRTIPLNLPENFVPGSQSAEVTVTGDIMGKPLSNLNNLVMLPQGSGEQNMMLLAPVISTMRYLSATGQLTDEIKEKAEGFMETGYQNQLNYKRKDGSYSAFGESDSSGSTWLTAFVARFFSLTREYIYIDSKPMTEPLDWLKGQQESNGCFKNVGQIFHKELQGGLDNQISLTAYVISTFLEVGEPQYDEIIEKAKQCLENCTQPQISTYTKAQCAYTYTLLADTEKRTQLLEQLDQVAIKQGNKTHWSKNSEIPQDDPLWSNPNSADVETTAYVVLAMESGNDPTKTDLGAAVPAVRWLNSKQNANGGYASTQDTVVAIMALSKFSSLTLVKESMPMMRKCNKVCS